MSSTHRGSSGSHGSPLVAAAKGVLRTSARGLTGWLFVEAGYAVVRAPGGRVDLAGGTLDAIRKVVPLPADDETLVKANGAAQLVAGAALALGILPRTSAAVLAASLLPTSIAGHPYWTIEDPAQRQAQKLQFQKNMAMLGGLLFAVIE